MEFISSISAFPGILSQKVLNTGWYWPEIFFLGTDAIPVKFFHAEP